MILSTHLRTLWQLLGVDNRLSVDIDEGLAADIVIETVEIGVQQTSGAGRQRLLQALSLDVRNDVFLDGLMDINPVVTELDSRECRFENPRYQLDLLGSHGIKGMGSGHG